MLPHCHFVCIPPQYNFFRPHNCKLPFLKLLHHGNRGKQLLLGHEASLWLLLKLRICATLKNCKNGGCIISGSFTVTQLIKWQREVFQLLIWDLTNKKTKNIKRDHHQRAILELSDNLSEWWIRICWQLRTEIQNNHCFTGQHSQFLQCSGHGLHFKYLFIFFGLMLVCSSFFRGLVKLTARLSVHWRYRWCRNLINAFFLTGLQQR